MRCMIRKVASLIWLIIATFSIVSGQGKLEFSKVDFGYGKNQSVIYSLCQDNSGYLWMATDEGIMRYNSHEAFLYNEYEGLARGIKNRVNTVFADSQNNIWAGNENGLLRLDRPSNSFVKYLTNDLGEIGEVKTIKETTNGLFIGSSSGLWHLSYGAKNSQNNIKKSVRLNNSTIIDIAFGNDGIFFCTNSSLYKYTSNGKLYKLDSNKTFTSLLFYDHQLYFSSSNGSVFKNVNNESVKVVQETGHPITRMLPINDHIYIATDGKGIKVLDKNFRVVENYYHEVNKTNSIGNNGVYDIFSDREGMFWAATYGGGLNKADLKGKIFLNVMHEQNNPNSLIDNFTRSLLEDAKGRLWIGTREGLSIWDRKSNLWKNIVSFDGGTSTDIIMSLCEQGDYIWAGTYGKGAYKINKNNLSFKRYSPFSNADVKIKISKIYSIVADPSNQVWLAGIDGDVHLIRPNDEVKTYHINPIRQLTLGIDGSILAAGKNGAFKIINDEVMQFFGLESGKNNLDYVTINSICQRQNGSIILGTNGDGILLYEPKKKSFKVINYKNGLPSDVVQSIVYIDNEHFWVSTTKGIALIKLDANNLPIITVYNDKDGIQSSDFNYGSSYLMKSGECVFGSSEGFTIFNPSKMDKQKVLPTVVFEAIEIHTQANPNKIIVPSDLSKIINLAYDENTLNIKFSGILHRFGPKVLYSWKLDGSNDEWSLPSSRDQLLLTKLTHGSYTLMVKAANRDNMWSEPVSLKLVISPPWWLSNLAKLIYFLMFLGLLYGLYKLSLVFFNKKQAEEQISFYNNITHELKTPLAILISSLDQNEKEEDHVILKSKVRKTVTKLSSLFEQLLNYDKFSSGHYENLEIVQIPVQSFVNDGIAGFKPLIEDKNLEIKLEITGNEEFLYHKKDIIDKIFCNLFSNAIKYSKPNGIINISIKAKEENFALTISDNGIGIPKEQQALISKRYYRARNAINSQLPGTGLGLMIVKNLVDIDKGTFSFESEENQGSSFTVGLSNHKSKFVNPDVSSLIIDDVNDTFDKSILDEYSGSKILVVEDNDELRLSLVEKLSQYFDVYEAINGKEAIEKIQNIFPDLIITDLVMPEIDGQELAKLIQQDMALNHIPIFMMTAINNAAQKTSSMVSGVAEYFDKPVNLNILLAKIVSTFSRQQKLRDKYLHETEVITSEKFKNTRDNDFVNSLEEYVLQKISDEEISVISLSKHVGMSRTALYMKLKSLLDISPQNFIILTKLKHARKLLMEGNHNITEVAFMTGFSNSKYFSTSFKKQFGESPSAFLKGLQQTNA
jgi:ligand-binding sensor domain-containing protein/CheY-like chemotaxis protein/AraC-like DNA-binding protein/two-component sensor histidine kinase